MADCEYQIGGKGKFYSESEFKKLLSEGYLDKVMMEKSLTIKGIKPNEAIASSFQLPSAIQPTVPVTEVKTEEVVTPTGDKNNYKIAQDVTAEVSKENPDASVLLTPKGEDLSLTAVYVGKENRGKGIGTKVLESVKKQADKLGKKIVLDATTELDEETDLGRLESFYQKNGFTKVGENKFEYNPTEQAATTETVTKTEEKVTEPTAEAKEEVSDDRVAEELAKSSNGNIDYVKKSISDVEKYNNGEMSPREYLESRGYSEEYFFEVGADRDVKDFLDLTEEEFKEVADRTAGYQNNKINEAKQKVQAETVTKTEPTTEKKPDVVKTKKSPTFEDDGEHIVTVNGEEVGRMFYDKSQKTWGNAEFDKSSVPGYSHQWVYGDILGDSRQEAIDELVKRHKESTATKQQEEVKKEEPKEKATPKKGNIVNRLLDGLKNLSGKTIEKNPLVRGEYIYGDEVSLSFNTFGAKNENEVKLEGIVAFEKGKGQGQAAMNDINKVADEQGVTLTLDAKPFGNDPNSLNKKQLIDFYKKNGFNVDPEYLENLEFESEQEAIDYAIENESEALPMVREPKTEAKKGKIETATKKFADSLREAKMSRGNTMSSLIPPPLWNKAIDIVADSVQAGGVALGKFTDFLDSSIKQIKDSDFFKDLSTNDKRNFSRNIRKELAKYAAEQFNLNFNQADMRDAEFNDLNDQLEAAKTTKITARQLEALKSKAKKFVERNLPNDVYNKTEVIKEINNNFDKTKTANGIQKALDRENKRIQNKEFKIETAEAKQSEKKRQSLIKEIINLTKPTSPKSISRNKRTGAKKGNISLDALRQMNDMRKQGMFDDQILQGKTLEELNALKEQIKNIQSKGREEKKVEDADKREVKKSGEATILQSLDKENKILDTKEDILEFMNKYNGVVVVDGQVMSKSAFKDYANKNPDEDYTGTKFYVDKGVDLKEQKKEKKGIIRAARKLTMGAIRDLDTYIKDISKGSKELRNWTKNNILDPTKVAIYNKVKNTAKFKGQYRDGVKNIFGGFNSAISYLSKDSGMTTDVSDLEGVKAKKISRDQAVHIYGLINNPNKDKAQANIDRLKNKNHIDTDKVKDLVESDPKLMAYYEFLKKKYNDQFRTEFGPTIENLYGIPLDEGYYWPEPAGTSEKLELNLEGFQNKDISMIAPNMRQREAGYDGAFELVNSYDMYNRYVESMVHAKEFIPVIEKSRTLLSDVNRPRVLEKLNDTNKYNDLIDLMKVIYTDKTPFNNTGMDFLANATAVKSLWFRLKAIPQQASAFINYYNAGWIDGINPIQILNSVVPKTSTQLDFALDFYRDNPYLWQRFKGASNQDMKAIEASVDSIVNEYGKKVIDIALFATLSPIKAGDFLATSTPLGGGAFAMAQFKMRLKENGGDYQDAKDFALRRWFEETERTQQPAIDKSIVSTVTYDPKYRFFLPFISAQNSMGKKVVKAAKDIQDWKNLTGKEQTQAVTDMLYYTLVGSIPFTLMSGSLLTLMDVYDEEDEVAKENMFERLGFDIVADNVMSQIQSLSYVGFITNSVLNEMRGREFFNNRPQGETVNSLIGFLSSMAMASSDWNFLSEDMKRDYFAKFKLKGNELEEFNALSEEDKMDYLTQNAVKSGFIPNESGAMDKFKEEFAKQSRFDRMGKKGLDDFLKGVGVDKPANLYRDLKNFINDNGSLIELVYGEGAGTTVSAPPFSENIPKQFMDAIEYKKDNQLFKSFSNEEYYDIYPAKPGGPISTPVTPTNLNQSKEAVGRIRVRRKKPGAERMMINEE